MNWFVHTSLKQSDLSHVEAKEEKETDLGHFCMWCERSQRFMGNKWPVLCRISYSVYDITYTEYISLCRMLLRPAIIISLTYLTWPTLVGCLFCLFIQQSWIRLFCVNWSQILSVLTVGFCILRTGSSSPGQTNGINSPEQLTGRFQVRIESVYSLSWLLTNEYTPVSRTVPQPHFVTQHCSSFIWIMCHFDILTTRDMLLIFY